MILNRPFSLAGDYNDVLDSRLDRFLHDVLNGRLVDDGQHFFGHRFGCRQETGTESGSRDNGLFHFFHLNKPPTS
jgi:hypothetical protein